MTTHPNPNALYAYYCHESNWSRPNLIGLHNWLNFKTGSWEIEKYDWKAQSWRAKKTKAVTTVFFSSTSTVEKKFKYPFCIICKHNHVLWLWSVIKEKTESQRAKFLWKTTCASIAYKGLTQCGSVLEQKNALSYDALAPLVYLYMVLNVFI